MSETKPIEVGPLSEATRIVAASAVLVEVAADADVEVLAGVAADVELDELDELVEEQAHSAQTATVASATVSMILVIRFNFGTFFHSGAVGFLMSAASM